MLNQELKSEYLENGFYFPLDVLSSTEVEELGVILNRIASSDKADSLGYRGQLSHLNAISPAVSDLTKTPIILDAVGSILGPNLMVWGASIFMKPANSTGFVSWHQDLTYWGLNNDEEVSVWVALGPVTKQNGCMKFVPGSHKEGQIPHVDIEDESNILTRGQHAQIEISDDQYVDVELDPGQASIHHGHLLHASGPNSTDQPRLGLVINYISTSVKQNKMAVDYAMLVRGEDHHNHFLHLPEPKDELDEEGLMWHRKIVESHKEALYEGAESLASLPKNLR